MDHIIMPCEEWVEKFAAFHLKDLPAIEQLSLQRHLQECPDCAVVYKVYNALDKRIRAQNSVFPRFERLPDLLSLLEEKESEKQSQAKKYSARNNGDGSNIKLVARFPIYWSELAYDEIDLAEYIIEDVAALALIQIFDSVTIDEVIVTLASSPSSEGEMIASICAQGFKPSPSIAYDQLNHIIEDRLAQALTEIFGMLNVECCAIL